MRRPIGFEVKEKADLVCKLKRFDRLILKGNVDADFAGNKDKRKSTIAYFFTLEDNCIT